MSTPLVALVLGAGPRVGASVISSLSSLGYTVALASRSGTDTPNSSGHLHLRADFTAPSTIPSLFASIRSTYATAPAVVVYNAAALTPPPDDANLFSVSEGKFVEDLNVNSVSAYVAAQCAVEGWKSLPAEVKKTFIYTGNALNTKVMPVPLMLTLGVGKAAAAYWVGLADLAGADKGYRFFYADERKEDGMQKGMELDGPAHGEFYAQLVKGEGSVPWHATFVKGKGYVEFK